jgi:low affinity Fe/Cu permease
MKTIEKLPTEKLPIKKKKNYNKMFDRIATKVTRLTGSAVTFLIATLFIVVWLTSGPLFGFSDTWQLVINTSTTIITFLMVFLIQQSQNKDTTAIQLKLNELIACNAKASNRLVDIEELTEEELLVLKKFYIHLSKTSEKDDQNLYTTHSLDEAIKNQTTKNEAYKYYSRKHHHHKKRNKPSTATPEKNGSRRNSVNS